MCNQALRWGWEMEKWTRKIPALNRVTSSAVSPTKRHAEALTPGICVDVTEVRSGH